MARYTVKRTTTYSVLFWMTRREINKNKAQHFLQKCRNLVYTNQLISFIKIREIAAIIFKFWNFTRYDHKTALTDKRKIVEKMAESTKQDLNQSDNQSIIAFRNLKDAKLFALDIGGSLTKIAYYSTRISQRVLYRPEPNSEIRYFLLKIYHHFVIVFCTS